MTQHEDSNIVTLTCSVTTDGRCRYTVKWLSDGNDVEMNRQSTREPSQLSCRAAVAFRASYYLYSSHRYFECEVGDGYLFHRFAFSLHSPVEKLGKNITSWRAFIKGGEWFPLWRFVSDVQITLVQCYKISSTVVQTQWQRLIYQQFVCLFLSCFYCR